jgi:hypothetical protein
MRQIAEFVAVLTCGNLFKGPFLVRICPQC